MKLMIFERIIIQKLYPNTGNLITQTIVKDISEKVRITQDEMKEIEFKIEENSKYIWNKDKDKGKDINFTEMEINLLKNEVEKLDKEEMITQDILGLCLKINDYKI